MAVLTDSPWAKEVVVSYFSGRLVEEVKREERLYVGGRGKGTIRTATTRVHRQPELAEARYMVWWSSAAIVQQARQRLRQVAPRAVTEFHAPPPVLSLEEYVLTVRVVRPPAQPTNHLFQGLGEGELIEGAELRTNRKLTFKPTRVVRDGLGAGTSLSFFFPRQQGTQSTLPAGTEWAEFMFKGKQGHALKVRFNLRDMQWAGQPDY